jgi:hypothetical protein
VDVVYLATNSTTAANGLLVNNVTPPLGNFSTTLFSEELRAVFELGGDLAT